MMQFNARELDDSPILTVTIVSDKFWNSRLIYSGLFLIFLLFVWRIYIQGGAWIGTLSFGLVFFLPMGMMLAYEFRFPKSISVMRNRLEFSFWMKKPVVIEIDNVIISTKGNNIQVADGKKSSETAKQIFIPKGYPNFSDLMETINHYMNSKM